MRNRTCQAGWNSFRPGPHDQARERTKYRVRMPGETGWNG